ncbi:MAG TPA: ATP-binding cassette domain-containing protein [Streptosporangiaceae bacterium]|nr:ATP-binding cassette domain-containing protein [Streptosporangiaceae bacterium]
MTANLAATAESQTGNIVEARGLVKSFGETPALRGASLAVRRGEIVAVMGPSGSGKSTLLHCLAGILVPEEGQAWFGGQRLDTLSDDRRSALRRDRFGFVFQSGQLVPELTAEQNVALPLRPGIESEHGGPGARRARRAARGTAERDSRRPRGARGTRGAEADRPRGISQPRRQSRRHRAGPRRSGFVRAARDRPRPWPLPGRGGDGGVPC